MSTVGLRGKWAECKVREYLNTASIMADTSAYRFPDARAGSFTTVPSDFMFVRQGRITFLEVKEINHTFRLPQKNFDAGKVARLHKWQMAGATALVLVYHEPYGMPGQAWRIAEAWRVLPVDQFFEKLPSWDLSESNLLTFSTAMTKILAWNTL